MLVSFIIPAYNAADTIVRCLESIRNLSFDKEDYEIIVIDDASIDNTVDVIDHYRSKMFDVSMSSVCNLTLFRQTENHRQGAARNRGLSVAKGEYICFVDADDAVAEGITIAIRMAKEMKADMVPYHLAYADEKGNITKEETHLSFDDGQIFSGIEMQNKHPYWLSGPVAYIYSREFLMKVNYPFTEDVLYEDSDFVVVHLYKAVRMVYSVELGYIAYYREGSTTHHISYKNVADYLLLGERMLRFYERIKAESGKRKEESTKQFAEGILEGACYNVAKSCMRMIKLGSIDEVKAYYERIDAHVSRERMCADERLHKYFWNAWTTLSLKYKHLTITFLAILLPIYRCVKR